MDIRPSDIVALKEKVGKLSYHQYIKEMTSTGVRSFASQKIVFDFPVTAVIGTNGGGKSTILGAAAIAYQGPPKPRDFFPKSNVSDESMAGWRIDYELVEKSKQKTGLFKCNSRFVNSRWRRENSLERPIVYLPILRTVPASEQIKYQKFVGTQKNASAIVSPLSPDVAQYAGRVLGKDIQDFKIVKTSKDDADFILVGSTKNKAGYSQFHFGAGEASIISMIIQIENAPESALVLIEEVENGLHPIATSKMIEYLIGAAKRKKLQVIFTTHSEAALVALPPEAIWACIDGSAYQGRLSISSLRAMTGRIDKDSVVFVEDEFAKDWVEDVLRQHAPSKLLTTEVHVAGGFPYIISVVKHHNTNSAITIKAKAVVDGDVEFVEDCSVCKLPGQNPELEIFDFVARNLDRLTSKLQQRCLCPHVKQDSIISSVGKVRVDTSDYHLLFSKLGDLLDFTSESTVRRAFISIYNEENKSSLDELVRFLS